MRGQGWGGVGRGIGILLALPGLAGCAVDFVDAEGNRRVIGLAAVTIPAKPVAADIRGACARSGMVETLGVVLYRNEGGTGLAAGYVRESATLLEECPGVGTAGP